MYTWPDLDIWFDTDWLYCFLFMIFIIQLSFIFILLCCYCTQCLYARALSFSYTLIRSLLTTLDLHVQILDMLYFSDQVFDEPVHVAWLPIWFWYSCLLLFLFLYFSWFLYTRSAFIPVLYLYDIIRGCLYVILQWVDSW